MKNFLRNFFSGKKTTEENIIANEEKSIAARDIIQIDTANDKNMSGEGCGCGGCRCGKQ